MEFIKYLIRNRKLKKYIKIIFLEKIFFKKAIKHENTYLVGYPLQRTLGKTSLIKKLSEKYNLTVISKYHLKFSKNTIRMGKIDKLNYIYQRYKPGTIFLVDGIDLESAYLLTAKGYILIGYSI